MDKKLNKYIEDFFVDSNRMIEEYTDTEGRVVISSESFNMLASALRNGLAMYNYVVENSLYKDDARIQHVLYTTGEKAAKLEINDKNAKDLNMKNALPKWEEVQGMLLALAFLILEKENDTT